MIKFENIQVSGFEAAFRGMRNPWETWHKSDSFFGLVNAQYNDNDYFVTDAWIRKEHPEIDEWSDTYEDLFGKFNDWLLTNGILRRDNEGDVFDCAYIGPNDMKLAQTLVAAGDDESKFMRMIHFQADITAPLRFIKEFDTYKVATTKNSCSTMHTLASTPITEECFSWDGYSDLSLIDPTGTPDTFFKMAVDNCEQLRQLYNETGDIRYWYALIDLLPDGWMMRFTYDCSYQTLRNMAFARQYHKQSEWSEDFCNMTKELPYGKELIWYRKEKKNG